jgi:predicted nucleic acid-binding Zn ribbon protein
MPQIRVFQCPGCHEFIATDAKSCRFCSIPIDAQAAQLGADAQEIENKQYRRKRYARHMLTGAGVFALGLIISLATFTAAVSSEEGGYYIVTYGLMLSGAGDFIYGLAGWISELK